jgi:hypothetical protein
MLMKGTKLQVNHAPLLNERVNSYADLPTGWGAVWEVSSAAVTVFLL